MDNFAVHMRVSGVSISDDDVNSRRAAATSLAAKWAKVNTISAIISKVADIAEALGGDGNPSPELGAEIQSAIQKKSSSFLYEERVLEVGVCAGMAMVSIFDDTPSTSGWLIKDIYAAALWSALAYQPILEAERRENLRREVLRDAECWSVESAEKARNRKIVSDPAELAITIDANNVATSNFKAVIIDSIEVLRRNAALDREELDFLWWAQLGRSRLLNRQLSDIVEPTRIIAAGVEGAKMLRRLPCEVHSEIVLRTLEQDPELNLKEILSAIGDDVSVLAQPFIGHDSVAKHPSIFPLLHALTTGETEQSGADVKRHVSEWGKRALLEASFANLISNGPAKL